MMPYKETSQKIQKTGRHLRFKTKVSALILPISLVLLLAGITLAVKSRNLNLSNSSNKTQNNSNQNAQQANDGTNSSSNDSSSKSPSVVATDSSGKPIALVPSAPGHIAIPTINVNAPIVNLGLNKNGTVQVPTDPWSVGWYTKSAAPGEMGPSVLIGHLDSATGPAIFWNLSKLGVGDKIEISRADGTTAVFQVSSIQSVPQNSFPSAKVYGATGQAELRLITCAGTWLSSQHHYSNNLIVYATLVDQYASK